MDKENPETLFEDEDGNWIQVYRNDDGVPEWYNLFLVENTLCISMSPETFENLKELFEGLK